MDPNNISATVTRGGRRVMLPGPSGKNVPVVLGPEISFSDKTGPKEISSDFRQHIERSRGTFVLIDEDMICTSRISGLCLYVQVREIANKYEDAVNCVLLARFGSQFYCVDVNDLGTIVSESIVSEADLPSYLESIRVEVIAIGETSIEGIDVLEEELILEGKGADKYSFLPEIAAFNRAGIPHPSRFKRPLLILLFAVIAIATAIAYYLHTEEVKRKEAEARAQQVPPPLIAADECVEQLIVYGKFVEEELPYLISNGLSAMSIENGLVRIEGRPQRGTFKTFAKSIIEDRGANIRLIGNSEERRLIIEGRQLSTFEQIFDTQSLWTVEVYAVLEFQQRQKFGIRQADGYTNNLYERIASLGSGTIVSEPVESFYPDGRALLDFEANIQGVLLTKNDLYEHARAFLGIPANCNSLSLEHNLTNDTTRFEVNVKYRGLQ